MENKEFLYVGHYVDRNGNYILKIGTTNNLERRRKEHCRKYLNAAHCPMPRGNEFVYDWSIPLSKYNTLRYEDSNRKKWQDEGIGLFVNNDRFCCGNKPEFVEITIRKTYRIDL